MNIPRTLCSLNTIFNMWSFEDELFSLKSNIFSHYILKKVLVNLWLNIIAYFFYTGKDDVR